jgi:hypothetical protein
MPNDKPTHLSIPRACDRYSTSRPTLYRVLGLLREQGKNAAVKNGRRTLVVTSILDDYYAALPPAKIKAPTPAAPPPVAAEHVEA